MLKANLASAQAALTTANNDVLTADKDVKAQELILASLEEAKGKSDAQVASAEKDLKKAEAALANEQSKLAAKS
jgi:multidrug resistance efflux pump